VAGALAERDFVTKLEKAGFVDVEVVTREPRSIDDFTMYPLFTPELIDLMRRLIPPEQQSSVATAVVVRARLASHPGDPKRQVE
jgi:arsenite methyltransferase